jgi:hypothetical protein
MEPEQARAATSTGEGGHEGHFGRDANLTDCCWRRGSLHDTPKTQTTIVGRGRPRLYRQIRNARERTEQTRCTGLVIARGQVVALQSTIALLRPG